MTCACASEKLILGIETSCDETAAAVVKDGRQVLSSIIASQEEIHSLFGGIVPEIASRKHTELLVSVTQKALDQAQVSWRDLSGIAVTNGPGLIGSLLVGVSAAKAYHAATGLPLVGVNHLQAHVAANFVDVCEKPLREADLPAVCLIVSGGHSDLVTMAQDLHRQAPPSAEELAQPLFSTEAQLPPRPGQATHRPSPLPPAPQTRTDNDQ